MEYQNLSSQNFSKSINFDIRLVGVWKITHLTKCYLKIAKILVKKNGMSIFWQPGEQILKEVQYDVLSWFLREVLLFQENWSLYFSFEEFHRSQ